MLVLSRKKSERLQIGEDVIVTVVFIGPNTVRIGIDAPRELNVKRLDPIPTEMVVVDGAITRRPVETHEQREHRQAMAELQSKPPVSIRHAK